MGNITYNIPRQDSRRFTSYSTYYTADGYKIIPVPEPDEIRGVLCGVCGEKFNNGEFSDCRKQNCPLPQEAQSE